MLFLFCFSFFFFTSGCAADHVADDERYEDDPGASFPFPERRLEGLEDAPPAEEVDEHAQLRHVLLLDRGFLDALHLRERPVALLDEEEDVDEDADVGREDEREGQLDAHVLDGHGAHQQAQGTAQVPRRHRVAHAARPAFDGGHVADVGDGGGQQALGTPAHGAEERHKVEDLDWPRRLPRVEEVAARPEHVAAHGDQERDLGEGEGGRTAVKYRICFILFSSQRGKER